MAIGGWWTRWLLTTSREAAWTSAAGSKRVKVVLRKLPGHVETAQDDAEPLRMLGLDLGYRASAEEELQALVPESPDGHVS